MAYIARDIKDRIAIGDNCFLMETLSDGRIALYPLPDQVIEAGTDINKALLQPIEDRVVWLMNRLYDDITANPFSISLESLDGISATGIWSEELARIEC